MQFSFFSFIQHFGHLYELRLREHERALWLGILLCVVAGFVADIQGVDLLAINGALWEIAVIWLGFSFVSGLAHLIDALACAGQCVVEVLRRPQLFLRFALSVEVDFPNVDPVRAHLLPPPLAPTFISHV